MQIMAARGGKHTHVIELPRPILGKRSCKTTQLSYLFVSLYGTHSTPRKGTA